jgi:hypothetical protein
MSAWREALRAMRMQIVVGVWVGTLVLVLLGVLWLQIPDSHVWEFVVSILFACGLLVLFFWFYCWVFRTMLKPWEEERWWLRWVLLAAVIVAWWLLQIPIDRLMEHRALYAGYWTSRLPHWLRGLRTYEHLVVLQSWLYFSLRLVVTGLLLPLAVVAGSSPLRESTGRIFGVWSRWWYWAAALVCGWVAFDITGQLMDWTPGHGLTGEILSLFLRLGFVFTLDVLLACFVLAVIVVGLGRGLVSPSLSDPNQRSVS